ncbi:MAG: tail fiber domain-containing protein [Roseibacillus sp.]
MKNTSRLIRNLSLAAIAGMFLASPIFAQEMNYQGRLTNAAGDPFTDGDYTLTFRLFDAATGGNLVWGPFITDGVTAVDGHGPLIPLANGRFNAAIGPEDTDGDLLADAFAGGDRYLELTVQGNAPITPRQRMLHSPEAFNAATLGAANRRIDVTDTGVFGDSTGFQPDGGNDGLFLQTTAGGESSGFFLNGDTAVLFNPGDSDLFKIYDEDNLAGGPVFRVGNSNGSITTNGNLTVAGTSNLTGNLTVGGNITAGTITGTLSTPSISIPGNLNVEGSLFGVDTSRNNVGINTNFADVTLNISATSGDTTFFRVADSGQSDRIRVNSNGVEISGSDNTGSLAALEINGGMFIDNNEIDSDLGLILNGNTGNAVTLGQGQNLVVDSNAVGINMSPATNFTFAVKGRAQDDGILFLENSSGVRAMIVRDNVPTNGENTLVVDGGATKSAGGSDWATFSDRRLKKDIQPYQSSLEKIRRVNTVSFRYKLNPELGFHSEKTEVGVIAQELQPIFPNAVFEDESGFLSVNPSEIKWASVNAIQELADKNDELAEENKELTNRLNALEQQLGSLVKTVEMLEGTSQENAVSQTD